MNHFEAIRDLLDVLVVSDEVHAFAIESAPGLGKSSTVEEALTQLGAKFRSIGSYSTPLHLFNMLSSAKRGEVLILDDCAGLFGNDAAMAILKGATWASAGHGGARKVRWGSTTSLKATDEFEFLGKLVLIANHIPRGDDTNAFLQRSLYLNVALTNEELAELLIEAAESEHHFEDVMLARRVASFLVKNLGRCNAREVNIRTLRKGYEIARVKPDRWKDLLTAILPASTPEDVVRTLARSKMPVVAQAREFVRLTRMSERSFYNYRKSVLGTESPRRHPAGSAM